MYKLEINKGHYNGCLGKGSVLEDQLIFEKRKDEVFLTIIKEYIINNLGKRKTFKKTINLTKILYLQYEVWGRIEYATKKILENKNNLYHEPQNPIDSASKDKIIIDNEIEILVNNFDSKEYRFFENSLIGFYNIAIEILEKSKI